MISDFNSRFDSHFSALRDRRCYLEAKGYYTQGDRMVWEPQDESDTEPVTPAYGPGAMAVGEVDNFYHDADDEF